MLLIFSKYLLKENYPNQINSFKENYNSHPNYPSLFAVTDTLSYLGIRNIAVQVEKDQLGNLPNRFIAELIQETKKTFVLVNKNSDHFNILDESGKEYSFSESEFIEKWTSTIIALETNPKEGINKRNIDSFLLLILLLIPISLFSFLYTDFNFPEFSLRLLNCFGLILALLIVREKYFESFDSIISKICSTGNSTGGCNKVLNSKIFPGNKIQFSDLPFIFFLSTYISLIITPSSWQIIGVLSILSIPVILFSIYFQIYKLKTICKLCMAISLVLLSTSVIYIFHRVENIFSMPDGIPTITVTGFCTIISWLIAKRIFEKLKDLKSQNINLLKFKKKYSIFNYLSTGVEYPQELQLLHCLRLGNNEADLILRLFISPSCGYCHSAYYDSIELMQKYPDSIKIEIYYNLNVENDNNPFLEIALNIIRIHDEDSNMTIEALDDWHINKFPKNKWLSKWGKLEPNSKKYKPVIESHYNWCKVNQFNFTPVRILGEKVIPNEYEIGEIGFFLPNILNDDSKSFIDISTSVSV